MAEGKEAKEYEGFIDFGQDVSEIHEPQPVPTGTYDLVITQAKAIKAQKEDGSGEYLKKIQIQIDFPGVKNAATMFHNLTLPQPGEDKKKFDFKVTLVKKFYKLFNVPMGQNGVNTTDLIGAKATSVFVELTSYTPKDGEGNDLTPVPQNQINLKNIKV